MEEHTKPNRNLAIAGFVLAFLVALVGLIVSIVAYVQFKEAGTKSKLALAGIIIASVNIVFTIFASIVLLAAAGTSASVILQAKCGSSREGMITYQGTMYDCSTLQQMDMN